MEYTLTSLLNCAIIWDHLTLSSQPLTKPQPYGKGKAAEAIVLILANTDSAHTAPHDQLSCKP